MVKRFLERLHALHATMFIRVRQKQAELSPPIRATTSFRQNIRLDERSCGLNHAIAHIITECVVDQLQAVDIDKNHGERQRGFFVQQPLHVVIMQAVMKPRQLIVVA